MRKNVFQSTLRFVAASTLGLTIVVQASARGTDVSGGGSINNGKISRHQIKDLIESSIQWNLDAALATVEEAYLNGQFWKNELGRADIAKERFGDIMPIGKKIFGGTDDIFSIVPNVTWDIRMNGPCIEVRDGKKKEVDAAAIPPSTICVSAQRLESKLTVHDAALRILALAAHEAAHLHPAVGIGKSSEPGVRALQNWILKNGAGRPMGGEAYANQVVATEMAIAGAMDGSYYAMDAIAQQKSLPEVCQIVDGMKSAMSRLAVSGNQGPYVLGGLSAWRGEGGPLATALAQKVFFAQLACVRDNDSMKQMMIGQINSKFPGKSDAKLVDVWRDLYLNSMLPPPPVVEKSVSVAALAYGDVAGLEKELKEIADLATKELDLIRALR